MYALLQKLNHRPTKQFVLSLYCAIDLTAVQSGFHVPCSSQWERRKKKRIICFWLKRKTPVRGKIDQQSNIVKYSTRQVNFLCFCCDLRGVFCPNDLNRLFTILVWRKLIFFDFQFKFFKYSLTMIDGLMVQREGLR